jgi:beta-phosphoglucomutase
MIEIEGKPLIKFCVDSLNYPFKEQHNLYFILLKEHVEKYDAEKKIREIFPDSKIMIIDKLTEGAACTVLKLKEYIDNDEELIVYLADINFKVDLKKWKEENPDADGFMPTFHSDNQKYSYAHMIGNYVGRVAEKVVISKNASAGFYYFKKGKYFVEAAEEMIKDDSKRAGLGEKKYFFICPVYNEMIKNGLKVKIVPSKFEFDLGDDKFIEKYVARKEGSKIKAVIFDLDGVLVDATEWHYESLNRALSLFGYEISREMHIREYNGLPTKKKLEMLSLQKGFPKALAEFVSKIKQAYTQEEIFTKCRPSFAKQIMLSKLKAEGYKLAVCSNALRESVEIMLRKSGIIDYFDFFVGNDEGHKPKPDPSIYLAAINRIGLEPAEVVIVEDAPHGIDAAKASGANTCEVSGYNDVNYTKIISFINKVEGKND